MILQNVNVFNGLSYVMAIYLGFAVTYFLNMLGGVILNCQIEHTETFSFYKIFVSFEKILFCAIAIFGLVCATNLITQGLFSIEESLSEVITSVISIGMFALVFAKGFIQKAFDLVDKIRRILEITDTSSQIDLTKVNSLTLDGDNVLFQEELEPDAKNPMG